MEVAVCYVVYSAARTLNSLRHLMEQQSRERSESYSIVIIMIFGSNAMSHYAAETVPLMLLPWLPVTLMSCFPDHARPISREYS
jgi:hypothetical protein